MNPTTPETPNQVPSPEPTPAPEAPIATTPLGSPTPEPKKSVSKKTFIIAGSIVGVVLLAIIAALVYVSMNSVSKQDYAAAATQFNKVSSASSALSGDVSALGRSVDDDDAAFNEDVIAAEASFTTLETENEALSSLKAVKVGEGKELYDTFNSKVKAYTENGQTILTSVKNVHPALVVCGDSGSSSDAAARVAALKACSESLNKVADLPNANFKTYIDTLKTAYTEYVAAYEASQAIASPFGAGNAQYKVERDKMSAAQKTISTASREFSAAMNKQDEALSVKDSAKALAAYLNEQQRK